MKNVCLLATVLLALLTSCSSQQALFTNETSETDNYRILQQYFNQKEPILKSGDKITVSIWGHEDLSIGSVNSKFNSSEETGKWVVIDHLGEVNLPKIGRIHLAGYNLKEVNYILEKKYGTFLREPVINVRVVNHFVTVLGEVNNPGRFELDNEKVTLVQILGEAKGLSDYSNNKQVKVIREVEGKPVELLVDMTDIIATTDFNITLQSRDIVYIEPTKEKKEDNMLRKATPIATVATAVAVLVSVLIK